MKVAIVLGTRAELIKTFPVMYELDRRGIEWTFIHTGQHNLGELTKIFKVKYPDIEITPPPKYTTTKFWTKTRKAIKWYTTIIPKIKKTINSIIDLKWVIYHGDTMSSAAASVAASKRLNTSKLYKNAHLEGGLRSGSLFEPFPEEISRRICDKFSDVIFAVSEGTKKNLERENQKGKIIHTGNTIVDSVVLVDKLGKKIKHPKGRYALVTIHRHENIKNRNRLKKIVDILNFVPIKTYFPIHDNTKKQLIKFNLYDKLLSNKNIEILKLKNYIEFIKWMKNSSLLITDGGSIQEESLVFKKPCLLLRMRTERIEGIIPRLNLLSKLDVEKSKKFLEYVLDKKWKPPKFRNPYGEFGVSKKVVDVLEYES